MPLNVRELVETYKTLSRFERYAGRNMDSVPVAEMENKVAEARKILESALDEYLKMDVSELHSSQLDLRRDIRNVEREIDWKRSHIESLEDDYNSGWNNEDDKAIIEDNILEAKQDLEGYEEKLDELTAQLET